jgi:hypothetical protein
MAILTMLDAQAASMGTMGDTIDHRYSAQHTIHYSPYTILYSPYTTHHSLHTIHYTLLTMHYTLLTIHYPHYPLYSPCTILTIHYTLLTIGRSTQEFGRSGAGGGAVLRKKGAGREGENVDGKDMTRGAVGLDAEAAAEFGGAAGSSEATGPPRKSSVFANANPLAAQRGSTNGAAKSKKVCV